MMEVIPYKKEHAYSIFESNIRERDSIIKNDIDEFAKGWEIAGPAYTVVIDGKIIFCAGIILTGWNRGEAWTLMSDLFHKYPKTCFKLCKNELNKIIKEHKLKRVQAIIDVGFDDGIHFAEHLGFKQEGLLRAYGPDNEDMLLFGRIQ